MIRPLARLGAIAAFALLAAAAIGSVTVAGIFRVRQPEIALRLAPWDARANAKAALNALANSKGRPPANAGERALRAFRRDPFATDAFTSLGLLAAFRRQNDQAQRIFSHAENVSRRNVETQLWLIEHNVQRNDIRAALAHYDIVLTVETEIRTALYPILMNASSERDIALELNRVLRKRPNWRIDFLTRFAFEARDAVALARVTRHNLDPAVREDREVVLYLFARFVALHRYDLAWAAYDEARGSRERPGALLTNGAFEQEGGFPPFDWRFAADGNLNPERRPQQGQGYSYALYLPGNAAVDGESASQLLRLAPGPYRISARVGDTSADRLERPYLKIMCAQETPRELLLADFPRAPAEGRPMTAQFTIPSTCPNQWISIWVRGHLDEQAQTSPWIAAISLQRR